jgi:hypothetical protein
MKHYSPPAFVCWLFESVLPGPYRDSMLGDLIEEYTLRIESTSPSTASRWFWGQACRSAPSMVWSSLRSRNCLISISIAMGVYIFMALLKSAADLIISRLLAPGQTMAVVLAPIVFVTTAAIGGCVAARIRRRATTFLALLVVITVVVLINLKVCSIPVPWWYPFGFLTLGPLAVIIAPALLGALRANS